MEETPPAASLGSAVSFGPFRLLAAEQLLLKEGRPVRVGSRALAILAVLVDRPGELVTKQELVSRVWPDTFVDDVNLRVQVSSLRRALGDGDGSARYIANISGRGYRFTAPVSVLQATGQPTDGPPAEDLTRIMGSEAGLPPRLRRMIGRDHAVKDLSEQLLAKRFVSIVGPGGIGKTTIAISIGHELLDDFQHAVRFIDLGPLSNPLLVPSLVATAVGLAVHSADVTPSLINFLQDKRMLVLLDSCEHVVDAVATLAERIFAGAPEVHLLATTREPLNVEGEHVHRLRPLQAPPVDADLDTATALRFPAVQLFVERAEAMGATLELTDADAPALGELCRTLDGIPLAIELAAGRVSAYGIRGIADLLDSRLVASIRGRRTALPRHQTLAATLDWSHDLLTEPERVIARRLSIFVGSFGLQAAQAVAEFSPLREFGALTGLASLVEKSLLTAEIGNSGARYRLLDTTRAYLKEKLVASAELLFVARRHAGYYCEILSEAESVGAEGSGRKRRDISEHLGNVRAALDWCFGPEGDVGLGTGLAAAAAPLFVRMSLLIECRRWSERAIAELDDARKGTSREIHLQAALGHSVMFTEGNSDRVRDAFGRGLELATKLDQPLSELRLLGGLQIFHERMADYHGSMAIAQQSEVVARRLGDPGAIAAARSLLGISYHLMGEHGTAGEHLDAALRQHSSSDEFMRVLFGFDYRNRAQITLARQLWLQGKSEQATRMADETIERAVQLGEPLTLAIALIWGIAVFIWNRDLARARLNVGRFIANAKRNSLRPYAALGNGFTGQLCILEGDFERGVETIGEALRLLHQARYELLTTTFNLDLAAGLKSLGRDAEALAVIDGALSETERNGDLLFLPELLRMRGELLVQAAQGRAEEAEGSLLASLQVARGQSALAWALRSATSLSLSMRARGRVDGAQTMLQAVYDSFDEGLDTADLKAARDTLNLLASG